MKAYPYTPVKTNVKPPWIARGCACLPQRYILSVYIVVGLITCYLMRVSVNLALNEMAFKLNTTKTSSNSSEETVGTICPLIEPKSNTTLDKAEFHWDQHMQHNIIKSLYVGYIVAHLPAGILADKFGGKHVFGAGILVSSFLSLTFPTLARISPWAFIAGRIVQGFGQGVMFPSMSALVAKWAPPNERATMTGIVQSGVMIGNAVGYIVSGLILSSFDGWEPVFYFCGVLGLLWCAGWYTLCYSSPAEHPFITEREKNMIETQIALTAKAKPKHIPWSSILTSLPFLSAIMVNFAHAWALFTMINEMPSYMGKVLHFDIKKSGFFSATPHIAMIPTSIISGYLADWLITKKYMAVTTNRKVFSFLANALPIPFMLLASYAACDRTSVILFFMCMMFFKGLSYSSVRANPVDLSPNYAGVLMGIMNGSGALAGLLSPIFVPMFITGDGSIEEWRNVFYMAAIVMVVFSIPFIFFGSGEVQPWNNAETMDRPEDPTPKVEDQETKT
ncbi:putative inorganic phosphate cotransporter isoform X3 [Macrosteles quadrilineatus]|uniref:putative inorganic phosphate cotransporter isoform X3 n=1 Tax=Macrosteles quadrilineatus TaxID=74068 RepID=UPI0023E0FA55|nr:putative inorganic phosphate cotransporter isoform X3 [Macrosteles quadrilineatus]